MLFLAGLFALAVVAWALAGLLSHGPGRMGQQVTIVWRGKPTFVKRQSPEEPRRKTPEPAR